jgi:formylglycine-generating enzyme required for sulfatase activity
VREGSPEDDGRAIALGSPIEVEPGSYLLAAAAPGRYATRLPLRLRRGQHEDVEMVLPPNDEIPPGFVYVPAGWSLLGVPEGEELRRAYQAAPEHMVHLGAFLIAKDETTFADYLDFLATLPRVERAARRGVHLDFEVDGTPVLVIGGRELRREDSLCRPKRSLHRCQHWPRMPVDNVSWEDATAYAEWFASTRFAGARLCTEREWERAARGADGRAFAHGDVLHPGDANYQETYAVDAEQMGADEVGSFPSDVSPFGARDMTGNDSEWVADKTDGALPGIHVARGGYGFNVTFNARAAVRHVYPDGPHPSVGFRICAEMPGNPDDR